MNVNVQALGAFAQINNATGRGIVQLAMNNEGQLTKAGTYSSGRLIGRNIRWAETEIRNNATRESFLRSLAQALGVGGDGENGTIVLTPKLLGDIATALDTNEGDGSGAKLLGKSDFKIKDGCIVGGRPLTERRITAIVNRVYEKANEGNVGRRLQRPIGEKLDSLGATFNNDLSREIANLKNSGWDAANSAPQRTLLASLLAGQVGISEEKLLSKGNSKKDEKYKPVQDLFTRLCSRFASDGADGTKFDEKGFREDLELLNGGALRTIWGENVGNVKTVNAIDFLRAMNENGPRARVDRINPSLREQVDGLFQKIDALVAKFGLVSKDGADIRQSAKDRILGKLALIGRQGKSMAKEIESAVKGLLTEEELGEALGKDKKKSSGAVTAAKGEYKNLMDDFVGSVYRELRRIYLNDAGAVEPLKDPPGLSQQESRTLHAMAQKTAEKELSRYDNLHNIYEIDKFLATYGSSLNRQNVENVIFNALCNDPLVRKIASAKVSKSEGSAESSTERYMADLEEDRKIRTGELSFPEKGTVPVQDGAQISDRLIKWLSTSFAQDSRNLVWKNMAHNAPQMHSSFLREVDKENLAQTVKVIDQHDNEKTLADEPKNMLPKDSPIFVGQVSVGGDGRKGYKAASNLVEFFENNVRQYNPEAYNEILSLISITLSGPDGFAGGLSHQFYSNYGWGTPNENVVKGNMTWVDMTEREISIKVNKDAENRPVLVLNQRQKITPHLDGLYPQGNGYYNSVPFVVPSKGYVDVVMTIPLDQKSPGTIQAPEGYQKDGKGNPPQIGNLPKFTIATTVTAAEE